MMVWQGITAIVNPILAENVFKVLAERDGAFIVILKSGVAEIFSAKTVYDTMLILNDFLADNLLWNGTGGIEMDEDPTGCLELGSVAFVQQAMQTLNLVGHPGVQAAVNIVGHYLWRRLDSCNKKVASRVSHDSDTSQAQSRRAPVDGDTSEHEDPAVDA